MCNSIICVFKLSKLFRIYISSPSLPILEITVSVPERFSHAINLILQAFDFILLILNVLILISDLRHCAVVLPLHVIAFFDSVLQASLEVMGIVLITRGSLFFVLVHEVLVFKRKNLFLESVYLVILIGHLIDQLFYPAYVLLVLSVAFCSDWSCHK